MNVLYYTSGITGSGRIVQGISINNAFKRKRINCNFIIISSTKLARLANAFKINHIEIPIEENDVLSKKNYSCSILFKTITEINPDVLIVDRLWFTITNFIDTLSCKKIFICSQVPDRFFHIDLPNETLKFNNNQFDKIFAIEPFKSIIQMEMINPLIMRNWDEIYNKKTALVKLGVNGVKKVCLNAINAKEDYLIKIKRKYSYIEDQGYDVIYTSNMKGGGIFPIVDYYNAFDLIICGAGYNQFWEAIYFNKEAVFEPVSTVFESQKKRIRECQEYYFNVNGADQLVDIIMTL